MRLLCIVLVQIHFMGIKNIQAEWNSTMSTAFFIENYWLWFCVLKNMSRLIGSVMGHFCANYTTFLRGDTTRLYLEMEQPQRETLSSSQYSQWVPNMITVLPSNRSYLRPYNSTQQTLTQKVIRQNLEAGRQEIEDFEAHSFKTKSLKLVSSFKGQRFERFAHDGEFAEHRIKVPAWCSKTSSYTRGDKNSDVKASYIIHWAFHPSDKWGKGR